jgi:hypothetical protein
VGLFGKTSFAQWNQSPLQLPADMLEGRIDEDTLVEEEEEDEEEVARPRQKSLYHTALQKMVTSFWRWSQQWTSSSSSSSSSSSIKTPSFVQTNFDQFRHVLPCPTSEDGDVPQLMLQQVWVPYGQVFFYDCWHAVIQEVETQQSCKSPLRECFSDMCMTRVHRNEFTVDEQQEYVERVQAALELNADQKVKGLVTQPDQLPNDDVKSLTDANLWLFQTHGILWYSLETKLLSSYPIACPCADMQTWIQEYCCNDEIHRVLAHLDRVVSSRSISSSTSSMALHESSPSDLVSILVLPFNFGDERFDESTSSSSATQLSVFLFHQPPQDIVIPYAFEDEPAADYSNYAPLPIPGDRDVLQSFRVLSVDRERKLVEHFYTEHMHADVSRSATKPARGADSKRKSAATARTATRSRRGAKKDAVDPFADAF